MTEGHLLNVHLGSTDPRGTFHSQTEQSSGVCVSGTERGGVRQQLFLRTPQEGTHIFRATINSLRSHVSKNHEHISVKFVTFR
ncbi:hypothetical protein AMECASPLE_021174 [Ameca splendens]|uniref:Uncharacterized protein n=1 Tax=Ameca splendens TaxID=208324 RepID=A0ABV0XSM8_9TELE